MTGPLAFRGTYADWRLIKTRGVVQVVMEVPLADANAAYQILGGMPDASREVWFAVAPLKLPATKPAKAEPAVKQKQPWEDMPPSAQAAMLGDKPEFRRFLCECHRDDAEECMGDPAECIRLICGVQSRADLNTNHRARVAWHTLQSEFEVWKLKDQVIA